MLELLEQLFRQVRAYMHSEHADRNQIYFQSSKHTTMLFDHEAEDIIISGLIESGHGFEVITEERPTFTTSSTPHYRIVIDPVDGSTNVSRGILTASVAMAVLPIDAPIDPAQVQWALVGELFSGTVYQAQRGGGAFRNGRRCQVSETTQLEDTILGMNFDGRDLETLRRLRNRADYDDVPALTQSQAAAAVRLAEQIINVLDAARQEPSRARMRDAMIVYERDVLHDLTWRP